MPASTAELISQLSSDREATREAAVARLTVIGARAVDRLLRLASSSASPVARAAALTALERIGDRRALGTALTLAGDSSPDVATAAIGVARTFLTGPQGVEAIDRLTVTALDRSRPPSVRAAAVDALQDLGPKTIAPLLEKVSDDPAIRYAEPASMRARLEGMARAPLSSLLQLTEEIRERERSAPRAERPHWLAARAAVHALLARRGSTIALYDLRETIEQARGPLPSDFLTAAALVGDASCLEPIAAAYASTKDLFWKKSLADAFSSIVRRHRLTRRNQVIKKIAARWPGAASGLGIRD